ncbi:2-nitropropane dioxygenase [Gorgonomyces haynaldii]|nr:2-nitropropane dioxygenase [Gorgonomyces haynaldii]
MFHYTTPELVVQVSQYGALGCLGPQPKDELKSSVKYIKQHCDYFACNLFVFSKQLFKNQPPVPLKITQKLNEFRAELGLPLSPLGSDRQDDYKEQVDVLIQEKVPVVIFTFGIPDQETITRFKQAGTLLIGSCTSLPEALDWQEAGVDYLIVQGSEAGGHRTSAHLPVYGDTGLLSLVPLIRQYTKLPVIGAGGIVNAQQIQAAMKAGCEGISMGTLFLTSKECKTPPAHRQRLFNLSPEDKTIITRAFTGRPARMFKNRFYNEIQEILDQLPGGERNIPWNFYARDIFGKASRSDRPDLFIVWGGQSSHLLKGVPTRPAKEILTTLEQQFVAIETSNPN